MVFYSDIFHSVPILWAVNPRAVVRCKVRVFVGGGEDFTELCVKGVGLCFWVSDPCVGLEQVRSTGLFFSLGPNIFPKFFVIVFGGEKVCDIIFMCLPALFLGEFFNGSEFVPRLISITGLSFLI